MASDIAPVAFAELLKIKHKIIDIYRKWERTSTGDETAHCMKTAVSHVIQAEVAWRPRTTTVDFKEANRLSSMFAGPFFCSAKHPWPRDIEGRLCLPIVQLDLRLAQNLSELKLPDGVIQAWSDGEIGYSVRLIPRGDYLPEEMISPHEIWTAEAFVEEPRFMMWGECVQIQSFERPFFSCELDESSVIELMAATAEIGAEVHLYQELCDSLQSLLRMIDKKSRRANYHAHLFGTFPAIQFTHDEVGLPLLLHVAGGEHNVQLHGVDAGAEIFVKEQDLAREFVIHVAC